MSFSYEISWTDLRERGEPVNDSKAGKWKLSVIPISGKRTIKIFATCDECVPYRFESWTVQDDGRVHPVIVGLREIRNHGWKATLDFGGEQKYRCVCPICRVDVAGYNGAPPSDVISGDDDAG